MLQCKHYITNNKVSEAYLALMPEYITGHFFLSAALFTFKL